MGNFVNSLTNTFYGVVNAFKSKKVKESKSTLLRLVLDEDFKSGVLNDKIWTKVRKSNAAWCLHASDDPDLFEFTNDGLRLHVKKDNMRYATCGITTANKVCVAKGKLEVVARMKNCPHSWHAIWLYGNNNSSQKEECEIDLSECFYDKGFTFQTIHNRHLHETTGSGSTWRAQLSAEKFNTFTCEFDEYSVRLYINGQKTKEFFNKNDGTYGFADPNNPMKLILSAQLGGGWPGWPDDKDILNGWIEFKSVKMWEYID